MLGSHCSSTLRIFAFSCIFEEERSLTEAQGKCSTDPSVEATFPTPIIELTYLASVVNGRSVAKNGGIPLVEC